LHGEKSECIACMHLNIIKKFLSQTEILTADTDFLLFCTDECAIKELIYSFCIGVTISKKKRTLGKILIKAP